MNLTEAETKEIEKTALELYPIQKAFGHPLNIDANEFGRKCYIAGATRMAEKKNLEVKVWKNTADEFKKYNDNLKAQLEAAQEEIKILKESVIKDGVIQVDSMTDTIKEKYKLQAELERVKAVAEKMVPILERFLKGVRLYGVQTDIYIEGTKVIAEYQTLN